MAQKILIVEDDADLTFMIKSALEKADFEVATAPEGAQGLKALKTFSPDLIIADLNMPVMSGWQFCLSVRQIEQFKNTPIMVLSGLFAQESQPEEFEPYNVCLPKPFDIFKLVGKVKELLKK